jgi:hypothetical protein
MKAAHGYAAVSMEVGICNTPLDIGLDAGAPRIRYSSGDGASICSRTASQAMPVSASSRLFLPEGPRRFICLNVSVNVAIRIRDIPVVAPPAASHSFLEQAEPLRIERPI